MYNKAIVVLCALFALGTVGCSSAPPVSQLQSQQQPPQSKLTKYEQFEKGLKDKGIAFEIVTMAAAMVGAEEGRKYKFTNDSAIEIYRFDSNSDAYKNAITNKVLKLEGFGSFPIAEINGNMVMVQSDIEENNKDAIVEIFRGLK